MTTMAKDGLPTTQPLHILRQPTNHRECPGSPDRQSDLTESDDDGENYIALLQYRDAHHALNLPPRDSSRPFPPETIQREYDAAKEKVLAEQDQCAASDKQAKGIFFLSQQNYFDLKLKALDQAYEELMGTDAREENARIRQEGEGAPEEEMPSENSHNKEVPSISTSAAVRSADLNLTVSVPSEDELDTIDIYFRPRPTPSTSSDMQRPSVSPSDVSSCSWDGSSIFSMASMGGLSDVLGPVYDSNNPGRVEKKAQKETIHTQSKETHHHSFPRPPSGINAKQRPRAQISPKSVIDHPASIHSNNHYDNTSVAERVKKGPHRVVGRQNNGLQNSHEATVAARKGILRALSEENSECLPFYDDKKRYLPNASNDNDTTAKHPTQKTESVQSQRQFQGRSDVMPNAANSLMASGAQTRPAPHEQTAAASRHDRPSSPTFAASGSRRGKVAHKHMVPSPQTYTYESFNAYGSFLQEGGYSYNSILQSGLELADELCTAFNDCCKMDLTAASAAFDASPSELDNAYLKEDESTLYTQSVLEDSLTTQSVIDEQSRAIISLGSMTQLTDSPSLVKKRRCREIDQRPTYPSHHRGCWCENGC